MGEFQYILNQSIFFTRHTILVFLVGFIPLTTAAQQPENTKAVSEALHTVLECIKNTSDLNLLFDAYKQPEKAILGEKSSEEMQVFTAMARKVHELAARSKDLEPILKLSDSLNNIQPVSQLLAFYKKIASVPSSVTDATELTTAINWLKDAKALHE